MGVSGLKKLKIYIESSVYSIMEKILTTVLQRTVRPLELVPDRAAFIFTILYSDIYKDIHFL